jgi:hypothetical protein
MTLEVQALQEYYIGGARIQLVDTGEKSKLLAENGNLVVVLNQTKFKTLDQAFNYGLELLAEEQSQIEYIRQNRQNPEENAKILSDNPELPEILKLKYISQKKSQILQVNPNAFIPDYSALSTPKALQATYLYYSLHQQIPQDCPADISDLFNQIRGKKNSDHYLDKLLSDEYDLEAEKKYYKALTEAVKDAKKLDKSSTKKFEYKPQIGPSNEEPEPVDPESIETKVTDFYGGYYRGYACQFDPAQQKIVQLPTELELYETPEETEQIKSAETYLYETVFQPGKDINLEIPYGSIPITETLTPGFSIYQATNGTFYLKQNALRNSTNSISQQVNSITQNFFSTTKQPLSFQFKIQPKLPITDQPDSEPEVWGELDNHAEQFLQKLEEDSSLSLSQKAKSIFSYVRSTFEYPADETTRNQMNQNYLSAGQGSLLAICKSKITDCYWSNIFAGQLFARLGVPTRIIAGHYIQKDPRFEFAAVAGIGHAWSEYFNGKHWERLDATPPQKEDDSKDEDQSENTTEQPKGDFGDSEPPEESDAEKPKLTQEQVKALVNQVLEDSEKAPPPPTPEQIFEQEKGVSYAKWQQVERFIKNVNATPVPAEQSITKKPSTLEQEWKQLFDLIYEKRKLPTQVYRGPVLQSEGDYLDDPVTAYIDLVSGESDPNGYKKTDVRIKTQVFTKKFEDDAILDLTASMEGKPMLEQRKMLLSGLYNLMNLNRKLSLSKYSSKLKAPLHLRSTVSVFKGDTLVKPLQSADQDIDEKILCKLFDELTQLDCGNGNLAGALRAYELTITEKQIAEIKAGKLTKVLTVVTDGQIADQASALATVNRLRAKGIVVNGLGFGEYSAQIAVVCHNPSDPDATKVLTDVTKAVITRHQMLTKALKKV